MKSNLVGYNQEKYLKFIAISVISRESSVLKCKNVISELQNVNNNIYSNIFLLSFQTQEFKFKLVGIDNDAEMKNQQKN